MSNNIGLTMNRRLLMADADLELEGPDRGPIVQSPDGHRHLILVDNDGNLSTVEVSASPEVDMDTRRARQAAKRDAMAEDKADFSAAGQLQEKIDAIAKFLGLIPRD